MTDSDCYAPTAMGQQEPERANTPQGDPWHAFGYVVAGVLAYGLLGWLVDRWLGTSFVVAIGILIGAGLGIYMTIARFDALPGWRHKRSRGNP